MFTQQQELFHWALPLCRLTYIPLSLHCRCNNPMKPSLIADLSNQKILEQLRIFGLVGKVISGPWMVQFYANKENRRHLETIPLMKACIESITSYIEDPSLMLSCKLLNPDFNEVTDSE